MYGPPGFILFTIMARRSIPSREEPVTDAATIDAGGLFR